MATSLSANALADSVKVRVDNHVFTVQKNLLMDRSEFFLVAFQRSFKEAFTSSITIQDHAPGLILRLIHFCKFGQYLVTPTPGFQKRWPEEARLLLDPHILPPPFRHNETSVKPGHAVVIHAMMLNLGDAFHMPLLEQCASDEFHETFRDPSIFSLASIQLNNYEFWMVLALLQDETFSIAKDVRSVVANRLVEYARFSPGSRAYYRADHRWSSFLVRTGRLQTPRPLYNATLVNSMVAQ